MSEVANTDLRRAHADFSAGDFAAAFTNATRVLRRMPQDARAHALRANAALKLEHWQEAIADLAWLLDRQPDHTTMRRNLSTCWMRLGNRHKEQNDRSAAENAYRKALAVDAGNRHAHYNFGLLALETGHLQDAVTHLRQAAQTDPTDVAAALKLAEALIANGEKAAAVAVIERSVEIGGTREQLQQCSRLLLDASSKEAAIALARRLIERNPEARAWAREFCRQLRKDSDLAASRELLDELRDRAGGDDERLRIDIASALGLPSTYPDRAALQATRVDFLRRLDALVQEYPPQRIARIAPSPEALLWDNFLLAYQGEDDLQPQRRFGDWLSTSLRALLPAHAVPLARMRRVRPRLAMISSRFHQCTVGAYFSSWVEHLAVSDWELVLVHVGDVRDALSARLARAASSEVGLAGNLSEAAETLRALGADLILYPDLGMDLRTLGLAALRLAPIQVCGWGHPVTTGLPTIDAYVSCAEMEPTDAQSHYSERLLTLPGLGTRYLAHDLPAPATRAAIGLPEKSTLYLVPQSLFKLHPDNDAVIVDIARRDPSAVFVFFDSKESGSREVFDARLAHAFNAADIATTGRYVFLPPRARADYLQVNMACDVMVDSLHFSGGNTSLDALHAGLPIVTCPGRFMRGRQSMAMLKHLGCAELIADSPTRLAELAVAVAHDRPRGAALSERIRADLPELTQSDAPLQALDAALKSLVADL